MLDFAAGPLQAIQGIVTLMVDDDETNLFPRPSCGAATLLLEVSKQQQTYLFSQTYTCIPTDLQPEVEFLRTETGLNDAAVDGSLLNRMLFRGTDNGPDDPAGDEMAQALRDLYQVTGKPVIVGVPHRIEKVTHTDRQSDGLASVVRFKVTLRFVNEQP